MELGKDTLYDEMFAENPRLANSYLEHVQADAAHDEGEKAKAAEPKVADDGKPKADAPSGKVTAADIQILEDEYFAREDGKLSPETRKKLSDRGFGEDVVSRLEDNFSGKKERNALLVERVFGSLEDYEKAKEVGQNPKIVPPHIWEMIVKDLKDHRRERVEGAADLLLKYTRGAGPGQSKADASAPDRTGTTPATPGGDEFKDDVEASEFYRKEILAKGFQSGSGQAAKKALSEFDRRSMGLLRSRRA